MNYLIIDTSSLALTALVVKDGQIFSEYLIEAGRHNGAVIPAIDKVLKDSCLELKDIGVFAAVTGPGSFTGIRIGVTVMNAFKDVFPEAKLVSVTAFEPMAVGKEDVITLIDARNGIYYGAEFNAGRIVRMGEYRQADIDLNPLPKVFNRNIDMSAELYAAVKSRAERGEFVSRLAPLYLKESQAERELKKRNYRLITMREEHIPGVAAIELASFKTPWTENMFYDAINADTTYNVVLESGGEIIGYACLLQIYDELHIMKIAVMSNLRRQGFGDILFENILAYARENTEVKYLTLEVRVSNIAAQSLYKKYGLRCVGQRKKYYEMKEDALIYTLDIR